ncbi:hypothetical protein DFJ74DRAFT_475781 [Hyaloraphidium curvatum]|nr:hypothetical protein DFJ74DRAFT_475781 [Hyaloraphidium curvatum]
MDSPCVRVYASGAVLSPNPQRPYPPAPRKGELLVRNVVVASNPKDFKLARTGAWDGGHIEGNDVAGIVEAVGDAAGGESGAGFQPGDRVAGFTRMASHDRFGAYQLYSVCPAHTAFRIASSVSFEDAAAVPLAFMTACLGLFIRLGLPEPTEHGGPNPGAKGRTIVVWGASSSVGSYAVQLAKVAGLRVIGVAGSGADVALEAGCDVVVDYRLPNLPARLRAALGGDTLDSALDAHSGPSGCSLSFLDLAAAMQPHGGKICVVRSVAPLPRTIPIPAADLARVPRNVELVPSLVGAAHDLARDGPFAARWFARVGRWLGEGTFHANRVRVLPGGLAGVPEGLRMLERGEVSGEKLVYRIADTPGLASL